MSRPQIVREWWLAAAVLGLAGCAKDSGDPLPDFFDGGRDGAVDSSVGDLALDAALDSTVNCKDYVYNTHGEVPRACIVRAPPGAVADWDDDGDRGVRNVRLVSVDGGVLAAVMCACTHESTLIVPEGADPKTWEPTGNIDTADYDLSCQQDSDCTLVFAGNLSFPCLGCPSGAISRQAESAYHHDLVQKRKGGFFGGLCSCGASGFPTCKAGRCTATSFGP
ncbi:MAG: hypothetical protein JWN04_5023 [Myxococcaceae bacterium]|nr:hypothetical protein [Myxococcaceae bacterium]